MGQRKNRLKICQRIFINNCRLTLFCRCNDKNFRNVQIGPGGTETDAWMDLESVLVSVLLRTYGWEVLEEQQLDSGGFLVLAVQNSGSIRQGRKRRRMRRKFTGWCGRLWLGKLRRTGLSRLIGSNGVICCWCWQDMLLTFLESWRLCNDLRVSFDKSGLLVLGNKKRIIAVCVYYTLWKNQLATP